MKNIYHLAHAIAANLCYGFPGRKLIVIGVTGTNGKTTTSQFIARILMQAGKKVAMASTINFQIGERAWVNDSKFTTLSSWKLQKFLRDAVAEGCEYVVIETSSHALDQNRVWGIPYAIAVMTNVTREHLDYHGTMARYRAAKRRLFRLATKAVVNLDMKDPEYFCNLSSKTGEKKKQALTYSVKDPQAHLLATDITLDFKGTEFTVGEIHVHLNIPGLFNIENALAALGVARLLQIDFSVAAAALGSVTGVPGRMALVPNHINADILIDYAVTPDAFEKLYASILPLKIPGSKIIHVFGACGQRDRGKRPQMGEIASSYADIIILTNEDPFYEDPEQIIDDIERGVTKKKKNPARDTAQSAVGGYFRIFDRREAIHKALTLAEIGDIVLVTGKGAEVSMAIGATHVPWNERQVVEEELAKIK
ncbi:MAG: UDP-N-acetylmuramoyl-L-alanyl-D-glutamate--2,6-diaminopimelate ligase [Candidatus Moranbacteria bacterium]|nr:UDP-N-acetylmuramoyl-L-alanyl-D-glutamate--2,6-diaminopimelate ligase [Candidatus Moranbacteria bacterium]